MSPSSVGLRLVIWATGAIALLIALPTTLFDIAAIVAAGLGAVIPAILPGRWPALTLELIVVLLSIAGSPGLLELLLLAAALYLHHTACALAAAIRLDTVVTASVFRRWLTRAAIAITPAVVLAGIGVVLPSGLRDSAPIILPVAGILLVVAVVAVLVRLARS